MPHSIIKIIFFFTMLFLLVICSYASSPESDLELLKGKQIDEKHLVHDHDIHLMRSRSNNLLVRYNPVSLTFGGLMYVYQRFVSPQLPSECLYEHNCSDFSRKLIYKYGLVKGVFTTSDRLMRCNRLSALDVHPLLVNEKTGKVIETIEVYKKD
ncbi:MAG: membrane protein insertion efficiency factor YidD [Bacteroidales bacterium]